MNQHDRKSDHVSKVKKRKRDRNSMRAHTSSTSQHTRHERDDGANYEQRKRHKKKKSKDKIARGKKTTIEPETILRMLLTVFPDAGKHILQVLKIVDSGAEFATSEIEDRRMRELLESFFENIGITYSCSSGTFVKGNSSKMELAKQFAWVEEGTLGIEKNNNLVKISSEESENGTSDDDVGPFPIGSSSIRKPSSTAFEKTWHSSESMVSKNPNIAGSSYDNQLKWMRSKNSQGNISDLMITKPDEKARKFRAGKNALTPAQASMVSRARQKESPADLILAEKVQEYEIARGKSLLEQNREHQATILIDRPSAGTNAEKTFSWDRERDLVAGYQIDKNRQTRIDQSNLQTRFSNPETSRKFL